MWSLSVEEQFYSVWPLVISACVLGTAGSPRLMVRRVAIVSALIIVVSLAVRAYLMQAKAFHHVYNGIDSRAGQLCAGTFLAAVSILWPTALRTLSRLAPFGLFGLAVIAGRLILDKMWLGVGYDIVAWLSVLLVAGAVTAEGWTGRLLADSRLRWLGVRAYALYLVHYPLFLVLTSTRLSWMPGWIVRGSRMILLIGIADALYRFVEKPLLRLRRHHSIFAQASPVHTRRVPPVATHGEAG
jgi:peptidoglycan/LPS O-acetylase OafA/YrhL